MDKKEALRIINELIETEKQKEPLYEVKSIFDQIKKAYTEPLNKSIDETKEFLKKSEDLDKALMLPLDPKIKHDISEKRNTLSAKGVHHNTGDSKKKHKSTLKELQSMPKPNLPKSEDLDKATGAPQMPALPKPQSMPKPKIAKMPKLEAPAPIAKVDPKTRLPGVLLDKANEEGVHQRSIIPNRTTPKMENKNSSSMGDDVRSSHLLPKDQSVHNYNTKAMGNAKSSAIAILQKLKSMPKPNLPKSEDLTKDGSTAAAPASRLDAGFGKVIIKNDLKKECIAKDDQPHLPNTPEDKAHDIAEGSSSVPESVDLMAKDFTKIRRIFEHLRNKKKDENWDRSAENVEIGKE